MSVASTSVEAYREHKATGKLGRQASSILERMEPGKDYSRKELSRLTGFELSAICGRVNELLSVGALQETQQRKCTITGKNIHPVRLRIANEPYSENLALF